MEYPIDLVMAFQRGVEGVLFLLPFCVLGIGMYILYIKNRGKK